MPGAVKKVEPAKDRLPGTRRFRSQVRDNAGHQSMAWAPLVAGMISLLLLALAAWLLLQARPWAP